MPKKFRKLPQSSFKKEQKIGAKDAHFEEIFGSKIFGAMASKDWRSYYPKKEIQNYGDCLSFSCLNTIETKAKEGGITDDDGNELNLSEIDLAVGSGTSQTGNSFNNVGERLRKVGVCLEKFAPYTPVWKDRQKVFNDIPSYAKRYCKDTGHAWVKVDRNSLKNALQVSPLWIGVGIGESYSTKSGTIANPITPPTKTLCYHAIELGFIDILGKLYTYDSYDRAEVVYSEDYQVLYAKLLTPNGLPDGWQTLNTSGKKLLTRLEGKYIFRADNGHGECYEVFSDKLEKVNFSINNERLFKIVQELLIKKEKTILPISEKDFSSLAEVIVVNAGKTKVEEIINVSSIMYKL